MTLTQSRLIDALSYNHITGEFTWKKQTARGKKGAKAGGKLSDGYWGIRVDGKLYRAHRLAWLYSNGVWPNVIDHINHDVLDNSIENLRDVGQYINSHNRRNVGKGWYKRGEGQYRARIRGGGGKVILLGTFKTEAAAHAAFVKAKLAILTEV